ncbi:hypothetical protein BH10ACI1_BH10ACI1_27730 [soil metagenome]
MENRKFSTKSFFLFLILLCGIIVRIDFAQDETKPFSINESPLPAPTEPVNDFAGAIDDATERELNQKIKDFKAKTNPQVVLAVAVVKTTGERPIFEYALAVARGWKIGTSDADNPSALLFIAIDDRKYFTIVSKDLQDELPDGLAGQLQRQYLVPAFKQGNYSKGVADTIDAYLRTIKAKQSGETVPVSGETDQTQKEKKPVSSFNFGFCLIALFVLLLFVFSRAGKSSRDKNDRNRWGGGGFGGGGGALPWIIGSIIANSGSSSSSSNWGSGSSSGGGSDWGGFGGGGDFDGGGAGGSW